MLPSQTGSGRGKGRVPQEGGGVEHLLHHAVGGDGGQGLLPGFQQAARGTARLTTTGDGRLALEEIQSQIPHQGLWQLSVPTGLGRDRAQPALAVDRRTGPTPGQPPTTKLEMGEQRRGL